MIKCISDVNKRLLHKQNKEVTLEESFCWLSVYVLEASKRLMGNTIDKYLKKKRFI